MTSAPLSPQALNRAPLARQRLLARTPLSADGDRLRALVKSNDWSETGLPQCG
jgi:hypothetical protein